MNNELCYTVIKRLVLKYSISNSNRNFLSVKIVLKIKSNDNKKVFWLEIYTIM